MRSEFSALRADVAAVKTDVSALKAEVSSIASKYAKSTRGSRKRCAFCTRISFNESPQFEVDRVMKAPIAACARACGILAVVLQASVASADEIKVLSSVGIKAVVEALAPQFEKSTKHKVVTTFDLSANVKKNIDSGAPFDVAILTPAMIDDLVAKGTVTPASRTVVARVGLALMIKAVHQSPTSAPSMRSRRRSSAPSPSPSCRRARAALPSSRSPRSSASPTRSRPRRRRTATR
jgi:hypothetical protein